MKKHLTYLLILCFTLFANAHAADKVKPVKKVKADASCNYYNDLNGKYYCVETSSTCDIAHAWYKESGSTASPQLIVLSKTSSSPCTRFEGYATLPGGGYIVVYVETCTCGNSLTTYVQFH